MSVLLTSGLTPPPTDEETSEGIRIAANLIAAAPDMLAALKEATILLSAAGYANGPVMSQARAAIAKAEGAS